MEAVASQVIFRAAWAWRSGPIEQLVALLSGVLVVGRQMAITQQARVDVEQVVRLRVGDVDEPVRVVEWYLVTECARDAK